MSLKRPHEDDASEELEEKIKKSKTSHETSKKHSLDSDEEDSDEEQKGKYEILADDDIEGQEDGVAGQDGDVKLTPFNMKEELEEGHFDTEGNYHWDKEAVIKDHWLDNIDWVKIKAKNDPSAKSGDDDDDEDNAPSPFDEVGAYREILSYMQPGETVAKSLRRLGGGASLSASERIKRKKAGLSLDTGGDPAKVTALTEVANRLLTKTGNMDVYQETYNYIRNRVGQPGGKSGDVLDMYSDDFDSKEKQRMNHKTVGPSTSTSTAAAADDEKEPAVLWEYKDAKNGDTVNGPFSSEQMQEMVDTGKFQEVWVRKVGSENDFYSSRRIDFELYT